ncbi:MAG: glycosyltransferase family 4 protein [Patescibacteria group bacterium]
MRLLIITQKVDADDSALGFFTRWIEEFAARCEQVIVICLEEGAHRLPQNVRVLSLGKERFKIQDSRFKLGRNIRYACRLVRYIVLQRREYGAVFAHMNPEYALLGGLFWRLVGKKSALWYVHGKVSWRLCLAAFLVNKIFTASTESCRLRSTKVEVVGHGIDVSSSILDFQTSQKWGIATTTNVAHANVAKPLRGFPDAAAELRLLTVGRISPVKDLRTLILGFLELRKRFPEAELSVVGEPITGGDRAHLAEMQRIASGAVRFCGGVPHAELPRWYAEATAFVHASQTGSMDKAVLEALAAGLPVFTSSDAFSEAIPGVRRFREGDPVDLAQKIERAFLRKELVINEKGSAYVKEYHSLPRLAEKIIAFYV